MEKRFLLDVGILGTSGNVKLPIRGSLNGIKFLGIFSVSQIILGFFCNLLIKAEVFPDTAPFPVGWTSMFIPEHQ